jgi:hypothetical protein
MYDSKDGISKSALFRVGIPMANLFFIFILLDNQSKISPVSSSMI